MQRKTVEIEHNGKTMRVVVQQSTARMGMLRSVLIEKGALASAGSTTNPEDVAMSILRAIYYPAFIAGTVENNFDHWPLSFEEFIDLPEPFEVEWERAIFELNPHWRFVYEPQDRTAEEEAEAKKKAPST